VHYELCIIFIIFAKNMAQQYFNQQDQFLASMIEAYHQGLFPGDEYKPYFDWKISKQFCITREMATRLMHKVRADLEPYYDTDSNEKIVDYLEAIDSEITKILVGGYYRN
jgi:Leu/Phe-tRNA-protein transferase